MNFLISTLTSPSLYKQNSTNELIMEIVIFFEVFILHLQPAKLFIEEKIAASERTCGWFDQYKELKEN